MSEHGKTWDKNRPDTRTICKCGREFDDDRGFAVHLGRMSKVSELVKERVKREKHD